MSAINTGSLNTNYPVPGVNNNSQGFRDNFSSIKNNIDIAASEISDLQNKAVLKSALTGTVLDNDMNNTLISNALTKGFRSTTLNLGNDVSGFVDIDFSKADVHFGTLTGDTVLKFVNWPKAGTHAKIQILFKIEKPDLTITFPESLDDSKNTLENKLINNNPTTTVSIPANVEFVHYVLSTYDCGETLTIAPMNRPRKSTQIMQGEPGFIYIPVEGTITATTSSPDINGINTFFPTALKIGKKIFDTDNNEIGVINTIFSNTYLRLTKNSKIVLTNQVFKTQQFLGNIGDKLGTVYVNDRAIFICTMDYDGVTEIWEQVSFDTGGAISAVTSIKVSGGITGLTFTPDSPITSYGEYIMGGVLSIANGGTGSNQIDAGYVTTDGTTFTSVQTIPSSDLSGIVAIESGGTGADNKIAALLNLLPDQTNQYGRVLGTDGVNVSWTDTTYILPIATTTELGGVVIDGTSITINSTTGVISATPYQLPSAGLGGDGILGGVKIDGTTITMDSSSVISATQYSLPIATDSSLGGIIVGSGLSINDQGILSNIYELPVASLTELGGVKIDGTSITITDGVISAVIEEFSTVAGTGTVGPLGLVRVDGVTISIDNNGVISLVSEDENGLVKFGDYASKSKYGVVKIGDGIDVSDGVISVTITADELPKTSSSQYGVAKVDGNTITAADGVISVAPSAGLSMVGEIKMWPTNTAPAGYFICNGAPIAIAQYPKLYSIIGTLYGGDGVTYFHLPNFADRMPVGTGNAYNPGATGGTKDAVLVGHSHVITLANGGSHSHTGSTQSAGTHGHTATTSSSGDSSGHQHYTFNTAQLSTEGAGTAVTASNYPAVKARSGGYTQNYSIAASSSPATVGLTSPAIGGNPEVSVTIDNAGAHTHTVSINSGGSHTHTGTSSYEGSTATDANLPPFLGISFIIKHD